MLLAGCAFLHLDADFPNHSRWIDDAAKFTDEGWYASGAINLHLTGHWLRPGDFNPMVTIPLWPALMAFFFHWTGIQIAVARGAAFVFTIGTVLVCGGLMRREHPTLAPVLMLLVGTSPVLYFFSRMALLEPALIFFLMAAALACYSERPPGAARAVVCGLLLSLAMFTKSSAIFVAPAIFYLFCFPHRHLWKSSGADRIRLIRSTALSVGTFTVCYGLYWLLVVHTHPADIHALYKENTPVLDRRSIEKSVRLVYRCFTWVDWILVPVAAVGAVLCMRRLKELWRDPLFGFAVLFFLGYSCFMVLHFDAEPHYFDVLVVPIMILVLLLLNALEEQMPMAAKAMGAVVLVAVVVNIAYIVRLIAHPEYTYRDACLEVRSRIDSDPTATRLVIGHGAVQTTYFTGVPALDDIGSSPLAEKIREYHPGWALLSAEKGGLGWSSIVPGYVFTQVGKYPVFDNPGRGFLFLYRIEPQTPGQDEGQGNAGRVPQEDAR